MFFHSVPISRCKTHGIFLQIFKSVHMKINKSLPINLNDGNLLKFSLRFAGVPASIYTLFPEELITQSVSRSTITLCSVTHAHVYCPSKYIPKPLTCT